MTRCDGSAVKMTKEEAQQLAHAKRLAEGLLGVVIRLSLQRLEQIEKAIAILTEGK